MSFSFGAGVRDSLSNLAASLGTGRDKAAHDAFTVPESQRVDPTHGATRYVHPRTGRSVTIDDVTGQVIQLGGDGFDY